MLKIAPSLTSWHQLAEIVLSQILVFNARRGSEASELTSDNLSHLTNSADPVLVSTLLHTNKQMLQRLSVTVVGK